jgi:hypothetical protein
MVLLGAAVMYANAQSASSICSYACCSDSACPSGQSCFNQGTPFSYCAVPAGCSSNANCGNGYNCVNNQCVLPPPPVETPPIISTPLLPVTPPPSCIIGSTVCTGTETSGPCRPELAQSQSACSLSQSTNPLYARFGGVVSPAGPGMCVLANSSLNSGNIFITTCNGTNNTNGACSPLRINQCASDRAAQATGPGCVSVKTGFPGVDPNTGLNYYYQVNCNTNSGTSGGTTSGSGGTSGTGGTTTNGGSSGTGFGSGGATGIPSSINANLNTAVTGFTQVLNNAFSQLGGGAGTSNPIPTTPGATGSVGSGGSASGSCSSAASATISSSVQTLQGIATILASNNVAPGVLTSIQNLINSISQVILALASCVAA